jgi:hypothetical protein
MGKVCCIQNVSLLYTITFREMLSLQQTYSEFCRDLSSVDFEKCAEPSEEHLGQNN